MSCLVCQSKCHLKCISLHEEELSSIVNDSSWYCMQCISSALPFNSIDDDDEYIQALSSKDHFELNWDRLYEKLFNPLSIEDNELESPLDDIDPDSNFYNDLVYQSASLCKLYTEDSFRNQFANSSGQFWLLNKGC